MLRPRKTKVIWRKHPTPNIPLDKLGALSLSKRQHPTSKVGLLAFMPPDNAGQFAAVEVLSPRADLREAAATLFSKLRRLDAAGLDLILAEPVPEHGLGVAIMDRLRKAAARG